MGRTGSGGYSRRDALKTGLLTGLGAILSRQGLSASGAAAETLITKAIPGTGEALPIIGVGTNHFNDSITAELRSVLTRFSALGSSVVDTAPAYGDSETVIGGLVADLNLRNKLFLATKITAWGRNLREPGKESFERSLSHLRTDHIDLLQVHSMSGTEVLMPEMLAWKRARKIRYIGLTTSSDSQQAQMTEEMRRFPVDFVQVNYSIAARNAEQNVFPQALKSRIAVVVNVPFGGPGGRNISNVRGKPLPAFAADIGVTTWAQLMLKYVASHPAVTCVIPGSTRTNHIEDNLRAGRGVLPDAAMRKQIEQYWDSVS